MLFPEDPVKRPSLWQSVATQLGREKFCFLIEDGVGKPMATARALSDELAAQTIERLRSSPICRIGSSRGIAVSPHFAGQQDGTLIRLTEFLTLPLGGNQQVSLSQMQRDLETAVVNLLYMSNGVSTVVAPLKVAPWDMKDARIESTNDEIIFHKV